MVSGCISVNGVGDFVKVDGIMNAEKYPMVISHGLDYREPGLTDITITDHTNRE